MQSFRTNQPQLDFVPTRKGKDKKKKKTPMQQAGANFVDQLGKYAIDKLKYRLGLNTELKYVDFSSQVNTTAATWASVLNICDTPIPQGLTDNTREGASVRVVRYSVGIQVQNGAANLITTTAVRLVGTRWERIPGSLLPNTGDVIEAGALLSAPTHDPVYKNRIFYDKIFTLGATNNGADPNLYNDSVAFNTPDFHLTWTTADTAGTTANSIGEFITWQSFASGFTASNPPTIAVYQRVEYVDN